MSATVTTIFCTGCQKQLRVPEAMLGKKVRCKNCGQVVPTSAPTPPPQPVAAPPTPAAAPTEKNNPTTVPDAKPLPASSAPPAKVMKEMPSWLVPTAIAVIVLGGLAGFAWTFLGSPTPTSTSPTTAAVQLAVASGGTTSTTSSGGGSMLAAANPIHSPAAPPPAVTRPTKPAPPSRPRVNYRGRIPFPYPARVLLIGAKNYLYLNPINPGAQEQKGNRDPLAFNALAKALVEEHGIPADQVVELTDVATRNNPFPPTKSVILATLSEFCAKARPQDHAVVLFVGYATEKDGKPYLVPLEGDPARPETLLPVQEVFDLLLKSPAHHKLFIGDLSPLDPTKPAIRPVPPALTAKCGEFFKLPRPGLEVWLSAEPGQTSHQFSSGGYLGSVFLHHLAKQADLRPMPNWKAIENDPEYAKGQRLPLTILAKSIAEATTKSAQDQAKAKQTPMLVGSLGTKPEEPPRDAPPAPLVKLIAPNTGDRDLVDGILRELPLMADPLREVRPGTLPAFDAKVLAKYQPDYRLDYKDLDALKSRVKDQPLRHLTVEATKQLEQRDWRLRPNFKPGNNEAQFKRQLEAEQLRPATLASDLQDLYDQLVAAGETRKSEKSPRWQANYDYVTARVLAKLITIQEYNFVLGNNLRKDSPSLKEPGKHNGWLIVPQEKLQQTETRALEKERKKILERIIKDHPGTPWEVLARREQATVLGQALQEARVE